MTGIWFLTHVQEPEHGTLRPGYLAGQRKPARHTPSLTWMASPWPSRLRGAGLGTSAPNWAGKQKRMALGTYPGGDASRGPRPARRSTRPADQSHHTNPRVHREQKRTAVRLADEDTFEAVYRK